VDAHGPLIHIGYHKTGTSWLQRFLFRNPKAGFFSTGKATDSPVNRLVATHPLDFRADAAIVDFAGPIDEIRRRGLLPVVSLERLSGHPFSGGYDSKDIAHRLAEVFPAGRVLVVIREQQDMIVSTYKQYIRAGGALPLARFLDPPVYRRPRTTHFDLRHFEYHRLLRAYVGLFGHGRVLALPYERLKGDPLGFVQAIVQFSGARPEAGALEALPFDQRPNLAAQTASVHVSRLLNRWFVATDINPAPILPWAGRGPLSVASAAALDRIVPAGVQLKLDRRIRATVREVVQGRYHESNLQSARIMGVDLEQYGYDIASASHAPEADAPADGLESAQARTK